MRYMIDIIWFSYTKMIGVTHETTCTKIRCGILFYINCYCFSRYKQI